MTGARGPLEGLPQSRSLLLPFVLLLWAVTVSSGCDKKSGKQDLQRHVSDLTNSVSNLVGDSGTVEEFHKLQQFEYTVVSLPADITPADLEVKLNELGVERWECFATERRLAAGHPERSELIVLCKRRPDTPLRFIPRALTGQ